MCRMAERSVLSMGNTSRLLSVMKRASSGEKIKFCVIGGSITQGSCADTPYECYAYRAFEWWKNTFPQSVIEYINAGIGATDSYIGVHRADRDVVSKSPDVVIVEFSVNDTRPDINLNSYDSLVRKILSAENRPAVILLFTVMENGVNLQREHIKVGMAYDLPMISYADAIFPEIEVGTMKWSEFSADDVHPDSKGHLIIGKLLSSYFDEVYKNIGSFCGEIKPFEVKPLNGDIYADAKLCDSRDIQPVYAEGFSESDVSWQFPYGWTSENGGTISFEVTAKNIGIMFYRTVDGLSGKYAVYTDGKRSALIDGDFTGGWGDYAGYEQILVSKAPEKHIIKIMPYDKTDKMKFSVLGICIS